MMMMMIIYIYITIDFSLDFSSSILCESTGLSSISRPKWPVWVLVFRSKPPCIYIQVHPLQDGCGRKNSPIRCGQGHMASSHSTSAGVKAPPRRSRPHHAGGSRPRGPTWRRAWTRSSHPANLGERWRKPMENWWKLSLMKTDEVENWSKLREWVRWRKGLRHVQNRSPIATALPIAPTSTSFPPSTSPQSMTSILQIKRGQKITHETPFKTASKLICCDLFGISSYQSLSVIYIYIYYPPPSPAIPKHTRHTLRPYLRHMGYLTPSDWSTPPGRSWPSSLHGSPGRRSPGPLPKSRRSRASPQRLLRWYSSLPTSPAWSPRTETLQKYTWLEAMKIIKYHPIWASFLTLPMKIMKTNSGMTSETDLADFQQKMCRNAMVLALKNQGFLQSLPETTGRHGHSC